jgi:hypothetical protein
LKVRLKHLLYFYFSLSSIILNAQEKIAYIDENKVCSCVKLTQTIIENDTILAWQDYSCPYDDLYYCDYDVEFFANSQKLLLPIESTKKPFTLIYKDINGCIQFLNASFKDSCFTFELISKRKITLKPHSIYSDTIVTIIEENGEKIEKTCIYNYIFHDFIDSKNIIYSVGNDFMDNYIFLGQEDFWLLYEGGSNCFWENFHAAVHLVGSLKAELFLTKNGEVNLKILESSSPEFEQKVIEFMKKTKWKTDKSIKNFKQVRVIFEV